MPGGVLKLSFTLKVWSCSYGIQLIEKHVCCKLRVCKASSNFNEVSKATFSSSLGEVTHLSRRTLTQQACWSLTLKTLPFLLHISFIPSDIIKTLHCRQIIAGGRFQQVTMQSLHPNNGLRTSFSKRPQPWCKQWTGSWDELESLQEWVFPGRLHFQAHHPR